MKADIYNSLATINRGFDAALDSLTMLQQQEILTADYVQQMMAIAEELRAGINFIVMQNLETREEADWAHFGKMRVNAEARLKSS